MIIILEIPRFILTFALACIEHRWQRYVYLTGYIISFLPLIGILFIYVIPSPKYKEQFRKIMKKTFCRSFFRTHVNIFRVEMRQNRVGCASETQLR